MSETLKPFHLLQHEGGKSSLFFMADAFYNDPIMDLLVEKSGIEKDYFNGYAWKRVVELFMTQNFPDHLEELQFDPEADMFSVIAEDHQLLENIARGFRQVLQDKASVERLFS